MKSIKKRLLGALTALSLSLTGLSAGMFGTTASAAQANWKFDFGNGGVSNGWTGVDAGTAYNASRGYGFAQTGNVGNVAAGGSGPGSDAVEFKSDDKANTFNVDLPKGLYEVRIAVGNAPRCCIKMEGMMQMMNLTRLNAIETVQLPVTDGQLNIQAVTGIKNGQRSISSVEITQLNTTAEMNPHVWICGDSTVANYYNQADTAQHGWGQIIGNYLKGTAAEGYVVRNMATSGQYAKGFVDGGQFAPIEAYGKTGDYYLIAIGINDTNYSNADEYTNVVTDMVQRAKKKGMTVMLVKQQGRHGDLNRNPKLGGRWFGGQLDSIGAAENVKVIDLFTAWQDFGFSIGGYDPMTEYYAANDDLHQSLKGSTKLAEMMAGLAFSGTTPSGPTVEPGASLEGEPAVFALRNGSSGQYLCIEGTPASGANVSQNASPMIAGGAALWKAVSDGNGSYRIVNAANENLFLDVAGAKTANGTNVGVWEKTDSDAQLFSFLKQTDGSYILATKASAGKSAVEVKGASDESGENIQEWERNGHACQTWFLDWADQPAADENALPGDLNGDGEIDAFDMALMKREMAASGFDLAARKKLDVNGDAKVDSTDLTQMRDFILGTGSMEAYSAGKRVYYAQDQASVRGFYEDTNAGFKGDKYLNLDNNVNSFMEFRVNAPKDGNYLCTLGVANGSNSNRQMKIEVNGGKDYWVQDFLSTNGWTNWEERAIVLPLVAGMNTIRMSSLTADGGPNLDYLRTELTDEPVPDFYTKPADPITPTGGKTTVYIAGDSTVQTYNQRAREQNGGPIQGWGAFLGDYMTENVTVANHALAGRSSKSFYDQGRLQTILDSIQKGDYLMVQFAINDAGKSNAERYAPTCGNVDNPASGSYEWYMTQYIKGAQEKGATPILVTTTLSAKSYSNGKFTTSYDNYRDACKKLAAKYKCPCIDLNQLMCDHYNKVGYNTACSYHMAAVVQGSTDQTHFNDDGAKVIAGLVANAVKGLNIGLSAEVK